MQYKLATQAQAAALFLRFYPDTLAESPEKFDSLLPADTEKHGNVDLLEMSERFAASVPPHEFSTAEIQGFLLSFKHEPRRAVEEIGAWVENERADREARLKREGERKEMLLAKRTVREEKLPRNHADKKTAKPLILNGSAIPVPMPVTSTSVDVSPAVSLDAASS